MNENIKKIGLYVVLVIGFGLIGLSATLTGPFVTILSTIGTGIVTWANTRLNTPIAKALGMGKPVIVPKPEPKKVTEYNVGPDGQLSEIKG